MTYITNQEMSLRHLLENLYNSQVNHITINYNLEKLFDQLQDELLLYHSIKDYGLSNIIYPFIEKIHPTLVHKISVESLNILPTFNEDYEIALETIREHYINIVEAIDTTIHKGLMSVFNMFSNSMKSLDAYYKRLLALEALLKNTRINPKYYSTMMLNKILRFDDFNTVITNMSDTVDKRADDLLRNKELLASLKTFDNIKGIGVKLEESSKNFKESTKELQEVIDKPVRNEYASIAKWDLENCVDLIEPMKKFMRECNEVFKNEVIYLKNDKSIDKQIKKYMNKIKKSFTKKKVESEEESEEIENKTTAVKNFSAKLQHYFKTQSVFFNIMISSSIKLAKMYIYISDKMLATGRVNKKEFQARQDKKQLRVEENKYQY
jgi:hypothetical protein